MVYNKIFENDDDIFIMNIEKETLENNNFRKVLYTADMQQIVVMSLKPHDVVDMELHKDHDQFMRIEKGMGKLYIGRGREKNYDLYDGVSVIVPRNTWHEIVNSSETEDLKLYSIYSPPEHDSNRIDVSKPNSNLDIWTRDYIMYFHT